MDYIVTPSYNVLAVMAAVAVVGMFASRVVLSVQERSERKRERVDLPLLRLALKEVEENQLQNNS